MSDIKEVVEIDAATAELIAKHVTAPEIDYDKIAEKLAEKTAIKDKEINKLADNKTVEAEIVSKFDKMGKEAFAVAQLNAALQGNHADLQELNDHAIKTLRDSGLVEKATYLNTGTPADGSVLIPNAELLNDVLDILPAFSPLANKLRVINLTAGNSIDVSALTTDVIMTEVGVEGGSKTVTKPVTGKTNIAVREFAGIALLTKKLLNQAAVDVYGMLRDSFARAIAKKREQLILTDATSGITQIAGTVNTVSPTGNTLVASVTLKQLKAMPFSVPTASAGSGLYVFSRLLVASLAGREDTTGQPIITINSQNGGTLEGTFNGYPFVVAETLGAADAVSTTHAVFGNFAQYGFVVRQGAIDTAVFDSGIVVDGGSVSHNLIQENKLAVRTETWENVGYPLPGAFVKLTTSAT
jgi:HK97 family phage major capsid protein